MSSAPQGTRMGPYALEKKLGQGGMGEVHLATDTRLERRVALKLLPAELRDDPDRRARFLREARAVAQLSHPNIAQLFDVGETEGRDYLAFELVEGRTLQEHLAERPLAVAELVELALPLADAVACAHERGIVHRDLKAANVMITPRGHPKLLDFGLAKILREGTQPPEAKRSTTLTLEGAIFGTPGAMSPEQALGRPVDSRSDIFSFGSLLYEMAAGRAAFRGTTVMEVMDAVIHREPDPLARVRPDLPAEFVQCVEKALRKDPGERYQTMNDLAADLRHFKRATDSGLVPPAEQRASTRAALLALGLLALGGLGYVGWRALGTHAPAAPAAAERRSLAVLPFEVLGNSTEDVSFAAGLHSDVLTRLSKIGSLKVIARTSVLEYAGSKMPLRTIGSELGVGAILSGELQRTGSALRLNLTLHDAASEDNLWAESYDREVTSKDLFAVQREVAEAVAGALRAQLSTSERSELRGVPTTNDKAYEAYLRGSSLRDAPHDSKLRESVQLLEQAVELDPGFAQAWAALSTSRGYVYWLIDPSDKAMLAGCSEAAQRALALAPDLPDAHLALGQYSYIRRDYEAAAREYEIAARGLPNSAELVLARGWLFRRVGNWEGAAQEFARSVELSPREHRLHNELAVTLNFLGRYDEALRHYALSRALGGPSTDCYYALCLIDRDGRVAPECLQWIGLDNADIGGDERIARWRVLVLAHEFARALALLEQEEPVLRGQWHEYPTALLRAQTREFLGDAQGARRDYEQARDEARARVAAVPADARLHAALALALAGLGEKEEALHEARAATEMLTVERDSIVGPAQLLDRFYVELRVGELDASVHTLEQYLSRPAPFALRALRLDPRLGALNGNAAFAELVKRRDRS